MGGGGGGGGDLANKVTGTIKDPVQAAQNTGGDISTGVKSWGKGFSDLNPFRAPDFKDIPDPTAPANLIRPSMNGMSEATVGKVRGPVNTAIGSVKDPKAALIDQSQQGQFRDFQTNLASQLAAQAAGQGPSLAAMQLKQGQEANLAATMAQLASQRGGANPAMARATMQTAAEIQGKAAQEAAQARLAEQLQAQQVLGQVAGQGRAADVEIAQQQAALNQQVALAKYQGDLQLAVEQGKLDQQTAMALFNEANQNARLNAQLAQQFQALQAQYAAMGLDADKANQLAALEIEKMKQGAVQAQNAQIASSHAAKTGLMGNVLSAAGTVAGAYFGGPMGAAAGSKAGDLVAPPDSGNPASASFVGPRQ